MYYSCVQSPKTVEVNTLVSMHSELIGNAPIVRNPQKGDLCVLASSSCRELRGSAGTRGRPVAGDNLVIRIVASA